MSAVLMLTAAQNWRGRLTSRTAEIRCDSGSATPLIILLIPAMAAMAGLAYDGGMLFTAKREAVNVAAAAARDGANDIDVASLYASNPVLATTAPGTAVAFAGNEGFGATSRFLSQTEIEVSVNRSVDMELLGIIGIGSQTVTATATSEIRLGP